VLPDCTTRNAHCRDQPYGPGSRDRNDIPRHVMECRTTLVRNCVARRLRTLRVDRVCAPAVAK